MKIKNKRGTYSDDSGMKVMALLELIVDEEKMDQILSEEVEARGLDPNSSLVKASREVAIIAIRPMLECMLGCVKCQIK